MPEIGDILKRPIVSERSYSLLPEGKYTFEVEWHANKQQIAQAVETAFEVHVERVNTMNVKPKPKRQGRFIGKTKKWKKAIVTLREGDKIAIFEGS